MVGVLGLSIGFFTLASLFGVIKGYKAKMVIHKRQAKLWDAQSRNNGCHCPCDICERGACHSSSDFALRLDPQEDFQLILLKCPPYSQFILIDDLPAAEMSDLPNQNLELADKEPFSLRLGQGVPLPSPSMKSLSVFSSPSEKDSAEVPQQQ